MERRLLPLGCRVMTMELAMRFLTDYLEGDRYFRIAYPEHNRVRARAQMAFLADLEKRAAEMEAFLETLS
jgi:N-acetylhexosamine 1-kinase